MTHVRALTIPDILEIEPKRIEDHRGFFSEVWNRAGLARHGINVDFVQDNHSLTMGAGVIRGLHYQRPPFAQAKLVRVVRGSVFDVAVDIRRGSPTYGAWAGLVLSADRWNQVFVPEGFAHGFVTLEPCCEVLYKVTAPYSREHDRSIRFDDLAIGIDWPIAVDRTALSQKDRDAPRLAESDSGFIFGFGACATS